MTRKRMTIAAAITLTAALALTGCGRDNFRDVKGITGHNADEYTLWNNVDGNPNLVRVCADGLAFLTTTRNYGDAVQRIPEWDAHCAAVAKEATR